MDLLISREDLEKRIKSDQRLGESELNLVSEEIFPALVRVMQVLSQKDVDIEPVSDAEKEIATLRRYCSVMASDYERSLDRLIKAGKDHDLDVLKVFGGLAEETKKTSQFLRMTAEGRLDNTIYEDELTKAHKDKNKIREERDRLATRLLAIESAMSGNSFLQ